MSHDHAAYMRQWRITRKENADKDRREALAKAWEQGYAEACDRSTDPYITADIEAGKPENPYRDSNVSHETKETR